MCKEHATWTLSLQSSCTLGKAQCFGFPIFFLDLMVLDFFLFPFGLALTMHAYVELDFGETTKMVFDWDLYSFRGRWSYPSKQCLSADSEIRFNFLLISESFHEQIAALSMIACHAWRNVRTLHNTIASNKPPCGVAVSGWELSVDVTWAYGNSQLEIRARVLETKKGPYRHDLRDCRVKYVVLRDN